jgi:hypothetical protein
MSLRSVWHYAVQRPALWLCCRVLAAPVWCWSAALFLYVASPWLPTSWLTDLTYVGIGLLALCLVGPEPVKSAGSTLIKSIPYGYRRRYVYWRFRAWMIDAGLTLKPNSDAQIVRHHPAHLRTPPLAKRYTQRSPYGMAVVVKGNKTGHDDYEFEKLAAKIRSRMACHDVFFEPFEGLSVTDRIINTVFRGHRDKKHWTRIDMVFSDPFARDITPDMLPRPTAPDKVGIGLDERGRLVEIAFWLAQLIMGSPGSGKSTLIWMQLLGLVRSGLPFITLVYDPKLQEFTELADAAYLYWTDDFAKFLQTCLDLLTQRQQDLAARGLKECPMGDPEFPWVVIVIDEIVTALMGLQDKEVKVRFKGQWMKAKDAFVAFLTIVRAAGFIPIACTQLVQKEYIPMRGLFAYKVVQRQPDPESTRIAFGGGEKVAEMYPAHKLAPTRDTAGVAWIDAGKGQVKFRGAKVSDVDRAEVVKGISAQTETLTVAKSPAAFAPSNEKVRESADA